MLKLDLSLSLLIQDPHAMRNGIRLARAEAFLMSTLDANNESRHAIFQSDDELCEFCVVCKNSANVWNPRVGLRIQPRHLIGLGDGIIPTKQTMNNSVILPKGEYQSGEIIYLSSRQATASGTVGDVDYDDVIKNFPRTREGILLPMLGLYALKLKSLHRDIIDQNKCSVEAAADELYHLGFISEPDFSDADKCLPPISLSQDYWTKTTPEDKKDWLRLKYNSPLGDFTYGVNQDVFFIATYLNDSRSMLPVSFWRYSQCPFSITLPCPQTEHTPLYCLDRVCAAKLVYMTEYPELADKNHDGQISIVSWVGGELNLHFADFTPLNGKKVVYLLFPAEGEKSDERAYRVMLKALARAYSCGNRNFECLIWETQTTIPYKDLFSQAVERGFLKIEQGQSDFNGLMEKALPWPCRETGRILFGRAYQSGRIHLIVAKRGVGKTEMQLLLSVMAASGLSIDNAFFAKNSLDPIRVLYIQSEMNTEIDFRKDRIPFALKLIAQRACQAERINLKHDIDFYQTGGSLVNAEEQCKVLKKLAELDSEGTSQWMLVIDSLRTEMPEVLNGGNVFMERVFPWLDFLRKKGIAISLLHHENQERGISGPGTIQDLADLVFHLVPTGKENAIGEADVNIVQEKMRLLKGKQQATAHWNWVTDENLGITRFLSEYLDEDSTLDNPDKSSQRFNSTEPPTSQPAVTNKASSPKLPESLKELQSLPKDKRTIMLFELWKLYGTQESVAKELGCSESSIASLMRDCGVNKHTLLEYLKKQNE